MTFRLAKETEKETVLALYKSVIGTEFCVWSDAYPTMLEINADMNNQSLYVLEDAGEIIGAVSVVPENELDHLPFWKEKAAAELGRIVIAKAHRGRGLARVMLHELLMILSVRGIPAVHLSTAKKNLPAQATYRRLGFETVGEAPLFGGEYYLLEKKL